MGSSWLVPQEQCQKKPKPAAVFNCGKALQQVAMQFSVFDNRQKRKIGGASSTRSVNTRVRSWDLTPSHRKPGECIDWSKYRLFRMKPQEHAQDTVDTCLFVIGTRWHSSANTFAFRLSENNAHVLSFFPEPTATVMTCSSPDYARMCSHETIIMRDVYILGRHQCTNGTVWGLRW